MIRVPRRDAQGDCWTEDGIAYLQRYRPGQHVHVGRDFSIPGNDASVEASMRLPALPRTWRTPTWRSCR